MTNTGQMSAIQKKWNKERYKEDVSVLPEGQLTKAKKMKRTDEEALKVNIYKKNSYYLKGFVGTTYENNCWKASTNNWNILAQTGVCLQLLTGRHTNLYYGFIIKNFTEIQ